MSHKSKVDLSGWLDFYTSLPLCQIVSQRVNSVDLSCCSLEELPAQLFYSQDLTHLNLKNNFISLHKGVPALTRWVSVTTTQSLLHPVCLGTRQQEERQMKSSIFLFLFSLLDVKRPSVGFTVLGSDHMVWRGSSLDQITDDVCGGSCVVWMIKREPHCWWEIWHPATWPLGLRAVLCGNAIFIVRERLWISAAVHFLTSSSMGQVPRQNTPKSKSSTTGCCNNDF